MTHLATNNIIPLSTFSPLLPLPPLPVEQTRRQYAYVGLKPGNLSYIIISLKPGNLSYIIIINQLRVSMKFNLRRVGLLILKSPPSR